MHNPAHNERKLFMHNAFCNSSQPKTAGFTLVEMSIVLVIISLVAGGVFAGATLVKTTQMRTSIMNITDFKTALSTFRERYDDIPGDMPNATDYWGAADGGNGIGADCGYLENLDGLTCNGNGNGIIESWASDVVVYEKLRAWQQLANAGLIKGQYIGSLNSSNKIEIGLTSPGAAYGNGTYDIYYTGSTGQIFGQYGHFIKLASPTSGTVNGPFVSAIDAKALDTKFDDGLADSGRMIATDSTTTSGCVSNGTSFSMPSDYRADGDEVSCRFYFWWE
jgi:prepilin-type N-terminal cleavage/methylation domain-containing protein